MNEAQRELCTQHHNTISVVGRGARIGIEECQHQFTMNRWNCSTYEHDPNARLFGHVLDISKFIYRVLVSIDLLNPSTLHKCYT